MKKILILSLLILLFNINGTYAAVELSIPGFPDPDLEDINNTVEEPTEDPIARDLPVDFPADELDETDTSLEPTNTTEQEAITSHASDATTENSFTSNYLLWGGIIVVIAGGLYLYLSKKDKY